MAKPPIDPKKGCKASTTNPNNWGTFEEALEAYEEQFGILNSEENP